MKDLLYYQDAYITQFTTKITKIAQDENQRHYIVLSNTAFYPTGGGQPHDTGVIGDIAITDVEKVADEIRHYCEQNPKHLHGEVNATIHWERRFDFMQQHSGQHILTAAFVELFTIPTVSFHLGSRYVTIDLQAEHISEEQYAQAEKRANAIITQNLPITTQWVTPQDLAKYPLRKAVTVDEDIRLVIIPDYDYNGCGGTHPTSTGQVNAIKIMHSEKSKGIIRLSFVCGARVLQELAVRKNVLTQTSQLLSVPEEEVAIATDKLLAQQKITDKALNSAREELLQYEAKALAQSEQAIITASFDDRSIQHLQKLARFIIAEREDAIVVVAAKNATKVQFVAACGASVSTSMRDIANFALPLVNGKGGGSPIFVQGGGESALTAEQFIAAVLEHLQS